VAGQIGVKTVEGAGGLIVANLRRPSPEPSMRIALAIIEAILGEAWFRVENWLEDLSFEVESIEAMLHGNNYPTRSSWNNATNHLTDIDSPILAGSRIIDVDGVTLDIDPVELLCRPIPTRPLAKQNLRIKYQFDFNHSFYPAFLSSVFIWHFYLAFLSGVFTGLNHL
jgi:hypothetical protein